jgi:cytochrome c oxidase subunit 2
LTSAGGAEAVGALISQDNGCITCHSIDGSELIGPSWKGLWGKTEQLEDGSSVNIDDNYIKESIVKPLEKIVDGYPAVMPAFTDLSDDELIAIIAYIKSLD